MESDATTLAEPQPPVEDLRPSRKRVIFWASVMALVLAGSFFLDVPIARHLHETGRDLWFDRWKIKTIFKAPGEAWFVVVVAIVLGFLHPLKWRATGFIVLAAALSGLHVLLKWSVGRTRPYELDLFPGELRAFYLQWFRHGVPGFFAQKNLSFPSGHTCTAFAFAAALGILMPRGRWLFYAAAALTGLQRVSENAHFLSDTVTAAVFGVGVTYELLWCITVLQLKQARKSPLETPSP